MPAWRAHCDIRNHSEMYIWPVNHAFWCIWNQSFFNNFWSKCVTVTSCANSWNTEIISMYAYLWWSYECHRRFKFSKGSSSSSSSMNSCNYDSNSVWVPNMKISRLVFRQTRARTRTREWMKWMNEWMKEWMNERMNEWINELMN